MQSSMIVADPAAPYAVQEVGVIVVAIVYLLVLGGVVAGATILCGWHEAKSVAMDWFHGKATLTCR